MTHCSGRHPQKHTPYGNGARIGTPRYLPPTLAQHHLTSLGAFRPCPGTGLSARSVSDLRFEPALVAALSPSIRRRNCGAAVQGGFDCALGGGGSSTPT